MKNEKLFNRTVDILVKAYLNDTLQHGECRACAVGNLIAANRGYKVDIENKAWIDNHGNEISANWTQIHSWGRMHVILDINNHRIIRGKAELESTGYSNDQTCQIEMAFESIKECDTDGYKGLMAVVDVLQQIHECTDEETQKAKDLFTKTV